MELKTTIRTQKNNKTVRFILGDKNILNQMNAKPNDVFEIIITGKLTKNKEGKTTLVEI